MINKLLVMGVFVFIGVWVKRLVVVVILLFFRRRVEKLILVVIVEVVSVVRRRRQVVVLRLLQYPYHPTQLFQLTLQPSHFLLLLQTLLRSTD